MNLLILSINYNQENQSQKLIEYYSPQLKRFGETVQDNISVVGGTDIDFNTAEEIHKLFCEVVIAPSYSEDAINLLKGKKNRIILIQKKIALPKLTVRTCLNGNLVQYRDDKTDCLDDLKYAEEQAAKVNSNCILYLQPEWSKREKVTPSIVDYVMKHPKWKVSLQTHKYLNIP